MTTILEQIKEANDIKKILPEQYEELAQELRTFIIESVSKNENQSRPAGLLRAALGFGFVLISYLVPKILSPASPSPGTM